MLRSQYFGAKLFAFGQTPFWDEPTKAILRQMLDQNYPDAKMLIGIHDADYFSRNAPAGSEGHFEVYAHNDGTTRDLWVAAGEISCLFGCEEIPQRNLLTRHGVRLETLARHAHVGKAKLFDTASEAWGWRGVARPGLQEPSIADIKLREVLPKLVEALKWAERESLKYLPSLFNNAQTQPLDAITREMVSYADEHPDASLSELYQHLLPRCYEWTASSLNNLQVSSTTKLFQFNRQTANLPRFRVLDLFLDPDTSEAAKTAYNAAVKGARIYDLSRFPPGAIPFDLVIPGRGRGTICLLDDHVLIQTDTPIALDAQSTVQSVEDLAAVVESQLGPGVVLIGKAVTFAAMISSEFIMVLTEEGSKYVTQTRAMIKRLSQSGVTLDLFPILRMKLDAWSALARCNLDLLLPPHLASAFETDCISAEDFGNSWREAVRRHKQVLRAIRALKSPEDLTAHLEQGQRQDWLDMLGDSVQAHSTLLTIRSKAEVLRQRASKYREESRKLAGRVQDLQRRKGAYFRKHIRPLNGKLQQLHQQGVTSGEEVDALKNEIDQHENTGRAKIELSIQKLLQKAEEVRQKQRETTQAYRRLETGNEAREARSILAACERKLEREKLCIVRNALLTTMGLPFTTHRPAAWWLPIVDPSGGWARACAETAEFYFETL